MSANVRYGIKAGRQAWLTQIPRPNSLLAILSIKLSKLLPPTHIELKMFSVRTSPFISECHAYLELFVLQDIPVNHACGVESCSCNSCGCNSVRICCFPQTRMMLCLHRGNWPFRPLTSTKLATHNPATVAPVVRARPESASEYFAIVVGTDIYN
jgi:hypothetical protein